MGVIQSRNSRRKSQSGHLDSSSKEESFDLRYPPSRSVTEGDIFDSGSGRKSSEQGPLAPPSSPSMNSIPNSTTTNDQLKDIPDR